MAQPERLQTKETSNQSFIPLTELLPREYWFGSENYMGPLKNRLGVDLSRIEMICRRANLPPLVLTSEAWTPPRATEPEIVGSSGDKLLAGGKQSIFKRHSEERSLQTPYVCIEPLPEHSNDQNGEPVSIGWMIKVNTRKIDYDFSQQHPLATTNEKDTHFVNQFDAVLKSSLVQVAFLETLVSRNPSIIHTIIEASLQTVDVIPGLTLSSMANFINYETQLFFWQNVKWIAINKARMMGTKRPWIDHRTLYNETMYVSNIWREQNFPQQYGQELKKSHYFRNRVLAGAIPGGWFTHTILSAATAAYIPPQPLVKVIE